MLALSVIMCVAACSSGHPTDAKNSTAHTTSVTFDGKTSCSSVMYVGESTSIGMITPRQIPASGERLEARMKNVGVNRLHVNVSGGRSSIERLLDRPSTMDVLTPSFVNRFKGCYFLALGVNDAADSSIPQSAGSARTRIELVLNRIGNHPVLWPLASTSDKLEGPYADSHMKAFDTELRAATKRHPNLRLYDWPTEMNPNWREGDGIHDVRRGSRERALMYANALAVAFPQGMPANHDTLVGSRWGKPASRSNEPSLPAAPQDGQSFWAGDTQALKLYTSGPSTP